MATRLSQKCVNNPQNAKYSLKMPLNRVSLTYKRVLPCYTISYIGEITRSGWVRYRVNVELNHDILPSDQPFSVKTSLSFQESLCCKNQPKCEEEPRRLDQALKGRQGEILNLSSWLGLAGLGSCIGSLGARHPVSTRLALSFLNTA